MTWITLKKYCELTGETSNTVHQRRKNGIWVDGIHCKIGPNNRLWINTEEVQKWV